MGALLIGDPSRWQGGKGKRETRGDRSDRHHGHRALPRLCAMMAGRSSTVATPARPNERESFRAPSENVSETADHVLYAEKFP
jgi:hypothetical protein